jgi:uncharacterized protein (TIGR02246 family)
VGTGFSENDHAQTKKAAEGELAMSEAYSVVERWAETLNAGDVAAIAALYAPEATIWETLGQVITTQPAEIRSYFEDAFRAGLKVELQPFVIHAAGEDVVIVAGHYELSRIADSEATTFPARYSFVLVRAGDGWLIAHHHSSLVPKPIE